MIIEYDNLYKSDTVEFEVDTKSKSDLYVYFTEDEDARSQRLTNPEKYKANVENEIDAPESKVQYVAKNKKDESFYLQVTTNTGVALHEPICLRFSASHKEH